MKNILFLLTLCLFASCKQSGTPNPIIPEHSVRVANAYKTPMNYDFYLNAEDFNNAVNPIANVRLEQGQITYIDFSEYLDLANVYIDIYSDDRNFANSFGRGEVFGTDSILGGVFPKIYDFYNGDSLSIFYLTHDRRSITWKAVDFWYDGTSVWNGLSEWKKDFKVRINKDGTAVINLRDALDNQLTFNGEIRAFWHNDLQINNNDSVGSGYYIIPHERGDGVLNSIFLYVSETEGYILKPML